MDLRHGSPPQHFVRSKTILPYSRAVVKYGREYLLDFCAFPSIHCRKIPYHATGISFLRYFCFFWPCGHNPFLSSCPGFCPQGRTLPLPLQQRDRKTPHLIRSAEKIYLFSLINNQSIGSIIFIYFVPPNIKRVFFLDRIYD